MLSYFNVSSYPSCVCQTCMCTYVFAGMLSHVPVWRPEFNIRCLFLLLFTAFLESGFCYSGAHHFVSTRCPVSPCDPLVSASPALGSHRYSATPIFSLAAGDTSERRLSCLCAQHLTHWTITVSKVNSHFMKESEWIDVGWLPQNQARDSHPQTQSPKSTGSEVM